MTFRRFTPGAGRRLSQTRRDAKLVCKWRTPVLSASGSDCLICRQEAMALMCWQDVAGGPGKAKEIQSKKPCIFSEKLCKLVQSVPILNKVLVVLPMQTPHMALMCWQRASALVWICARKCKANCLDFPGLTTQNRSPLPTH